MIEYLIYYFLGKSWEGELPPDIASVSEEARVNLDALYQGTTVSPHIFWLSIAGLIWLLIVRWRWIPFFIVPLIFAVMGIFRSERFVIFLIPFLALGFGFLISRL